jgi:hypothetical protein
LPNTDNASWNAVVPVESDSQVMFVKEFLPSTIIPFAKGGLR